MSETPTLQAEDVRKVFRRDGYDIEVLKGVSLSLARGETAGVVGISGAGKTTLLQILGTLDRATSGQVLSGGHDVTSLPADEMAGFRTRPVGFVFQAHHPLPECSLLEHGVRPGGTAALRGEKPKHHARDLPSATVDNPHRDGRRAPMPGTRAAGSLAA